MPQYPHITFPTQITNPDGSTTVVSIPNPGFSVEEKAVIQLAIDGEDLFQNGLEEQIIKANTNVLAAISRLNYLNVADNGIPPEPNYPPLFDSLDDLISDLLTLSQYLVGSPPSGNNYLNHVRRISGSSGGSLYDEPDGELYGFTALQGIASAYNGAREAMRAEGDPVRDYYSQHFSGILDAGQSLTKDLVNLVDYEYGGFLQPPIVLSINGINLLTSADTGEVEFTVSDIQPTRDLVNSLITAVSNIISSDNSTLSFSVDYLKKYALGATILGMAKDEFFGGRLLEVIKSEELSDKIDDL